MPEQLVFALAQPGPPTFASFVVGSNAEAVALLSHAAHYGSRDAIVIWGGAGAGKTHLLHAAVAAAGEAGREATFVDAAGDTADASAINAADTADFVAVDALQHASALTQARLFTLFNRLRERGGTFVAAAALPPARIALRDDLRTRMGSGVVLELRTLDDSDKPAALAAYAEERGLRLPDDVIAYLLTHGRRDMPALVATLGALDAYSLSRKRPLTLPLLREWMLATQPVMPRND